MAPNYTNIFHFFLLFISLCNAKNSPNPKSLILDVIKDSSTSQYITQINQRTPSIPIKLTIHLGGQTLWVDCEKGYVSSTYKSAICGSPECTIAKPNTCYNCTSSPSPVPGCNLNACLNTPENPFILTFYDGGEIAVDVLSLRSKGKFVEIPRFIFTCVPSFLTEGLANGVSGTVGLGRNDISLPSQLSKALGFARKFALCLSSSTISKGFVFFGDDLDVKKLALVYTPLLINKFGTGNVPFLNEPSSEYFIGVKAISINGKTLPIDRKLLAISAKDGNGGTKISTGRAYTSMESSIYTAVSKAFTEGLSNATRVQPVAPFGTCFSSKSIRDARFGPEVPAIDLILQTTRVFWRIYGSNSMIRVSKDVICLAIVDGGTRTPTTSIVIGGYQIEDSVLQFDIENSRLGFSSSVLFQHTTCDQLIKV